jgi:hypothetical protein
VHKFFRQSLVFTALLGPAVTLANFLDVSYFKNGNPLNDSDVTVSSLNGYFISTDKFKIVRSDYQFEITTAFGLGDPQENGKPELKPYEGSEEIRYEETLDFDSSDVRFGASNLTYWLGKTVDKIVDLGYLGSKKLDIKVYSHCKDMLNAYYSPVDNVICVGHLHKTLGKESLEGMASLAWDADVIVHELGHGVYNNLTTMTRNNYVSFGNDMVSAMNEGQADFMAHVVTGAEILAPWMMNMAKEYYKKIAPHVYPYVKDKQGLRHIANDFKLNTHFFGEIHDDGSVIAGALQKVADKIGKETSLNIWLETITRIHEANNFYDFGKIMEQVDEEQNNGVNKQAIEESFKDHAIYGNPEMLEGDIVAEAKIVDDKETLIEILKSLGIDKEETLNQLTENNNGNGQLDKNECISLEVAFKNVSDKDLVGLEVFIPKHMVPKGLSNQGQNRNYLGFLKPGITFPIEVNYKNKRRPWFYVCATEDFEQEQTLPVFVRNSGENTVKIEVKIN